MRVDARCIGLAFLTVWGVPSIAGTYCAGNDKTLPNYDPAYYSVPKEFARAKYVVRAKSIKEMWIGEDGKPTTLKPPFLNGGSTPLGFDPYLGAYYDVEVVETFKASPPKQLRLFSENSTGRFYLDVGREFLLFVFDEVFDPPIRRALTADNCGNSAYTDKAQSAIKILRQLSGKK
jgi:hypothetical protein